MRPIKTALTALFGSTLLLSVPAFAQSGDWKYMGSNNNGIKMWIQKEFKPYSRYEWYWYKSSSGQTYGPSLYRVDCKRMVESYAYRDGDFGDWKSYPNPRSQGYKILEEVCR